MGACASKRAILYVDNDESATRAPQPKGSNLRPLKPSDSAQDVSVYTGSRSRQASSTAGVQSTNRRKLRQQAPTFESADLSDEEAYKRIKHPDDETFWPNVPRPPLPGFGDANLKYENLVFEGGGMKGMIYTGAVAALEKRGILPHVKRFAGTSAGALIAAYLAMGLDSSQVRTELGKISMYDLLHDAKMFSGKLSGVNMGALDFMAGLQNLKNEYGLHPARKLYEELGNAFERITGYADITFKQLYMVYGVELCIVVTNLTRCVGEHCHVKTSPDMPIRVAVRSTMSLPVLLQPIRMVPPYTGAGKCEYYVDGAACDNFPLNAYDGWWLSMKPEDGLLEKFMAARANTSSHEEAEENIVQLLASRFDGFNPHTLGFVLSDCTETKTCLDHMTTEHRASMELESHEAPALPVTNLTKKFKDSQKEQKMQVSQRKECACAVDLLLGAIDQIFVDYHASSDTDGTPAYMQSIPKDVLINAIRRVNDEERVPIAGFVSSDVSNNDVQSSGPSELTTQKATKLRSARPRAVSGTPGLGKLAKLKLGSLALCSCSLQQLVLEQTTFDPSEDEMITTKILGPADALKKLTRAGVPTTDCVLTFSCFARINLPKVDRVQAKIPAASQFFAFVYPVAMDRAARRKVLAISEASSDFESFRSLALYGGYVYINASGKVEAINAFYAAGKNEGFFFEGPYKMYPNVQKKMANDGRFLPVTMTELQQLGAASFSWIHPNEFDKNPGKQPAPYGAFAYSDSLHKGIDDTAGSAVYFRLTPSDVKHALVSIELDHNLASNWAVDDIKPLSMHLSFELPFSAVVEYVALSYGASEQDMTLLGPNGDRLAGTDTLRGIGITESGVEVNLRCVGKDGGSPRLALDHSKIEIMPLGGTLQDSKLSEVSQENKLISITATMSSQKEHRGKVVNLEGTRSILEVFGFRTAEQLVGELDVNDDGTIGAAEIFYFVRKYGEDNLAVALGRSPSEVDSFLSVFTGFIEATYRVLDEYKATAKDVERTCILNTGYVKMTDFLYEADDEEYCYQRGLRIVNKFLLYKKRSGHGKDAFAFTSKEIEKQRKDLLLWQRELERQAVMRLQHAARSMKRVMAIREDSVMCEESAREVAASALEYSEHSRRRGGTKLDSSQEVLARRQRPRGGALEHSEYTRRRGSTTYS